MSPTNRLNTVLASGKKLLSVYLTAGFPKLSDTVPLCRALQESGADMIEIGFPFSDPLADGPVIQHSSETALKNGMSLALLFGQLKEVRAAVRLPLMLMGYINPVLQFGVERFAAQCAACGIDGVILPDLPMAEYLRHYREVFERHNLHFIFFVTSGTGEERTREVDSLSTGFIYAVSAPSVTGTALSIDAAREAYFKRLHDMRLTTPVLVGFGIANRAGFNAAARYTHGAIVGSAFIKAIENAPDLRGAVRDFIRGFI